MMPKNQISRRTVLTLLTAAGAGTLLGCDPAGDLVVSAQSPDPLLVEVDRGLALLNRSGPHVFGAAVPTANGSAVFATAPDGADTAFWRVDTGSGIESTRVKLPGVWLPHAVSGDGTRVALTVSAVNPTNGKPGAAAATAVLIADQRGVRQRLDLPGNFVPEAFTDDLLGLFVLEWLPASAPDRYRVRLVDLPTGVADPLLTRDKQPVPSGAEEEMRGDGRQAVLSPSRRLLYTLYTHQPDHQHTGELTGARAGSDVHAFVHTLNLSERWAYCIDLPHPFGEQPAAGHAMAISPDGARLFVVDAGSGKVAELSTEGLAPLAFATIPPVQGTAHAAFSERGLFIGVGTQVRALNPAGLTMGAQWQAPHPITGLLVSPDGERVYLGQPDAVSWHDPASGTELGRCAVPGLVALRGHAGR